MMHPGLGSGVNGAGFKRRFRQSGPHIDDFSVTLLDHDRRYRLGHKKHRLKTGIQGKVPFFFGDFQSVCSNRPGGIVEQNIDFPEMGVNLADHVTNLGHIGQIGRDNKRLTAQGIDLSSRFVQCGAIAADQCDVGAGFSQRHGQCTTDSLRCAGDDGDFIF